MSAVVTLERQPLELSDGDVVPFEVLKEDDGVYWFPAREAGAQSPNSPTKRTRLSLTEARHEAICNWIAQGHFLSAACRNAKVTPATVRTWLKKGEPRSIVVDGEQIEAYPDNAYGRFRVDYDEASAAAENYAVRAVRRQFNDDWRAPMEFLKVRFPKDWSPKAQIEVTINEADKVTAAKQELFAKLDAIQGGVNELTTEAHGQIVDAEVVEGDDDEG